MSRGKPLVHVAVIHPIESSWFCFGCREQNGAQIDKREREFAELPKWLLFGGVDFDYLSESVLPTLRGAGRTFGAMKYDAISVRSLATIRSTTLHRLEGFVKTGGTVIFAGDIPLLMDG